MTKYTAAGFISILLGICSIPVFLYKLFFIVLGNGGESLTLIPLLMIIAGLILGLLSWKNGSKMGMIGTTIICIIILIIILEIMS